MEVFLAVATRIERIPPAEVRLAEDNAALLQAMGIAVIHLCGSPGAGKTSLLLRTIEGLSSRLRLGAIQASLSAAAEPGPLESLDTPLVQVNTGGQPRLDSSMLREALRELPLADIDLLLIEEIGTLTSIERSLGGNRHVVIASLPEGENCPLRYPEPFSLADAIVLNKLDLLPVLGFDRPRFERAVRRVNAEAPILELSCRTAQGLEAWERWLLEVVAPLRN